jgi:hypothetical protein
MRISFPVWAGVAPMSDEFTMEELRVRATQGKMDDAFRDAMHKAIKTGEGICATVVSTTTGTRRPIVVLAL